MKTVILSLLLVLPNILLSQSKLEVSFSEYKIFAVEDSINNPSVNSQSDVIMEGTSECFYIFDLSLCKLFFFENDLLADVGDIIGFDKTDDNYRILITSPNKLNGGTLTSRIEISSVIDKKNTNFTISWYYNEINASFSLVGSSPMVRYP